MRRRPTKFTRTDTRLPYTTLFRSEGSNVVDRVEHSAEFQAGAGSFDGKVRLPDEYAGHVIVFRTYDKVSYGLVMDSTKPTRIGYNLTHTDAPYCDSGFPDLTTRRRPSSPTSFPHYADAQSEGSREGKGCGS